MVSSALRWSPQQTHRIGVSVKLWAVYLLCNLQLAIKVEVEVALTELIKLKRFL